MGSSSNLNYKNLATGMPPNASGGGSGGWPPGSFPLARQNSIYSLTFDEFQNTVGSVGKEFGSMNMDELLKNIWSAEENQILISTSNNSNNNNNNSNKGGGFQEGSGYNPLRQGSLTLPRTLSQKTVDEVWQDMVKEYEKDPSGGPMGGYGVAPAHRQPTLGEVTLEEFLVRAGVVKEEPPKPKTPFGDPSRPANIPRPGFGYPSGAGAAGLVSDGAAENISNLMGAQLDNLPLGASGARSTVKQPTSRPVHPQPQTQLPEIIPKQAVPRYNQLISNNPGIRGGIMGMQENGASDALIQNAGLQGLVGNGVRVVSPAVSPEGVTRSNGEMSSVSPVPYVFNGGGVGLRGRKTAALEKVVERRQRRMIKNRESAARSRARKQAYTTELEAEVAKLKEENELLQKKRAEMLEMQKNQVLEMLKLQHSNKRRCLRRTQTGPW
ncbi:ABSCISIC ACID-INSENSITIVE 5-like protein 5 [Striga hermonthica]|uniref:ABSCISIC ACID-INSENSITIVE 5-like protein 5 n=1 Tax=Striga hermonthica TaxID=68872 RepID=A0A9N7R9N5_STRHE|nr:ABSCISIC ACID-INSENSITIVE 5-like protein 5 [Striga hermonthica]